MARQARLKSKSGIYHIILRGINRQVIFEDDEDKLKFLECLCYYRNVCDYTVYGYCLMDNHVHLLIKESEEEIASIMKRIGVCYVSWYNRKYDRCGHLFQDRFKSEVIEDDAYLLVVLRYIHQNPLKAGLVQSLYDFRFSSYCEFINTDQIVDINFILGMFSLDSELAREDYVRFMNETSDNDDCLEYKEQVTLKDEEVKVLIQKNANVSTSQELQTMKRSERNAILKEIKKIQGITTRQIARLTGISQSVITRA
ncbi:transposase [Sporomusa sp. KB1]|jgi:REP element-mobilizing transposase RayT|uniref:transposase n=1 Tax=Sporomusa sp. KB1 TaxID=943346 RepID=UPI0011A430EF|nr:transposase [Sporomusa sp. KB1]TWH46240.1 REP element-mobilizing transposase RayT [Sporomusa sp. KB1]